MCQKGFTKIIVGGLQIMRMISDILSRQCGKSNCNGQNICTFFCAVAQTKKDLLLSEEEEHIFEKQIYKDGTGRTVFTLLQFIKDSF